MDSASLFGANSPLDSPQVSYNLHIPICSRPVESLDAELSFTNYEWVTLQLLLSDEMLSVMGSPIGLHHI